MYRKISTEEIEDFLNFMEKYPHNLQEGFERYAIIKQTNWRRYRYLWYTCSQAVAMRKERAKLLSASPKVALVAGKITKRVKDPETGEMINDTNTTGNIPVTRNASRIIRGLVDQWFTTITR